VGQKGHDGKALAIGKKAVKKHLECWPEPTSLPATESARDGAAPP
jgi:hypothetical protein